jgi:hypothetical protein
MTELENKALQEFTLENLGRRLGRGYYGTVYPHPNAPDDLVIKTPNNTRIPRTQVIKPVLQEKQYKPLEIGQAIAAEDVLRQNRAPIEVMKRLPGKSPSKSGKYGL